VRRRFWFAVVALIPGLLLLNAHAGGVKNSPTGSVIDKAIPTDGEVCTTDGCGTTINFVKTPSDAARLALKEEKLVFVLHVSGVFEDPGLT
jgi:hypothetical protein